jgi:type IV secretory pathway TraG/TraD family ATPase VirD4
VYSDVRSSALVVGPPASGKTVSVIVPWLQQVVWDSAGTRLVLGGQANASDLQDMSALCGNVDVQEHTGGNGSGWGAAAKAAWSGQPAGGSKGHMVTKTKPVFSPSEIRTMRAGRGVLLLPEPPAEIRLTPWMKRKDAADLQASKKSVEAALRAGAEKGTERESGHIGFIASGSGTSTPAGPREDWNDQDDDEEQAG